MTNQKNYTYPDVNDSLTVQMIGEIEEETGINWGNDENNVLDNLKQAIQKNVNKNGSLLIDFGCGEGRLLAEFEKYFEKIIAVEPDKLRLEKAVKFANKSNICDKTLFINELIENAIIPEPADTVILSHIIQHIHPNTVNPIFKKINKNLKDGGLFYLATNNMNGHRDKYSKSHRVNNKLYDTRINRKEFISLINNNMGILPVHWFSQKKLVKMLTDNGFKILYSSTFHGSKNHPDRDLAIIARKTAD